MQELANKTWDVQAIEARYRALLTKGIPKKALDSKKIIARKSEILDRIQRHAEEYEYLGHNCAKGSALSVMEEFGLGNIAMIKGLSALPGFGATGWMCGAVSGGIFAMGLYFGSDNIADYDATGKTISAARKFIPRFEKILGSILCPKIQEDVIFGRYMDARASPENMEAFKHEKGYAKCALPTGIGARLAAELIIESMEESVR